MASKCSRIINRATISTLRSALKKSNSPCATTSFPKPSLPSKPPSIWRCPAELGCVSSMLPLHSAVATARMTSCLSSTSRSCRALSQGVSVVPQQITREFEMCVVTTRVPLNGLSRPLDRRRTVPTVPTWIFSACFVLTRTLPGKTSQGSLIIELLQVKHA